MKVEAKTLKKIEANPTQQRKTELHTMTKWDFFSR